MELLQLLLAILQGIQLVVAALEMEQLLMGALLNDLAVGQQNDVVRMLDGGQAVCHNQHGADVFHLLQRVLNEQLGLRVDGVGGVGGLAGELKNAVLTNCYWSGNLSGQTERGGIAGTDSGSTFSDCFFDGESCAYGVADSSCSGVTARSRAELKQQSCYSGWDFKRVWKQLGSFNDEMPVLL